MGIKTLDQLKVGSKATVNKILGEGALKRHILDMGITKGATIEIHKAAPFGDPIQITVRGFELSLRKEDAKIIEVLAPDNDSRKQLRENKGEYRRKLRAEHQNRV